MAFTASTVWECWSNGNDASAGGFDPGVAGFPTDGTVDSNTGNTAAPVFSSASYNFAAGDVNAWIYIKSGTNSIPGWYKIASVASNKATLNATIGAAVLAAGTPTTVVGLATVGTPTSLTWGIDYSQSASARIAFTDMTILGTNTQFTSAANPVGKNFVGNIINVTGGVGFTVQRIVIISTSGTTATCDKAVGTALSVNGTGNLGGAFASPALPLSVAIAGNTVWVLNGSYSITSASTNVTGGCISAAVALRIEGYGTTRGDLSSPPTLTASGISTFTCIATASGSECLLRNLIVNCASLTTSRAFSLGTSVGYLLTGKNCTNGAFINNSLNSVLIRCVATGCSTVTAIQNTNCFGCVAYANSITGFSTSTNYQSFVNCISYGNSGASTDGFSSTGVSTQLANCIAYNNGRDGFRATGTGSTFVNCIAESNSGNGINISSQLTIAISCAFYLNGTNLPAAGTLSIAINPITLTASAFVNAASGNFALNAAAGGGALLRAAGIPGVTPDGLSTGYLDIGAIQSKALATLGVGFEGGMNT